MTGEKLAGALVHYTGEDGKKVDCVDLPCPSCKFYPINLPVDTNNPNEIFFFKCPSCEQISTISKTKFKIS